MISLMLFQFAFGAYPLPHDNNQWSDPVFTQSIDYADVGQSSPPKSVIPDSKDPGNQQYSSRPDPILNFSF